MTDRIQLARARHRARAARNGRSAGGATPSAGAQAACGEIWSSEYWAKKGDVPLWMFRKRLAAPVAGEPALPVLFFVHGSSVTSRVFDLNVPSHGEYSVMNEFARYGFDCWTMDHENYGKSGRTSGNSDIASGVEDLRPPNCPARPARKNSLRRRSPALRAGIAWYSLPSLTRARVRRH